MPEKVALGLDVGGTSIKSALVTHKGEMLHKSSTPTTTHSEKAGLVNLISHIIQKLIDSLDSQSTLSGVGIGIPGNVCRQKGLIRGAYNLPALVNFSLTNELAKTIPYPIFIDNDATNAAKGEFLFGAGKGQDHMLMLTIGTGIGGGIILNRRVFHGVTDYAGEVGHMTLVKDGMACSCGNHGCFEAYASSTAMIRYAREAVRRESPSSLQKVPVEAIDGKIISQLAIDGDEVCITIIRTLGHYIGLAISNIINLLNIPLVVVGGGVSECGDMLFQEIEKSCQDHVLPFLRDTYSIKKALLGNDAGVIGSASTVFMKGETVY